MYVLTAPANAAAPLLSEHCDELGHCVGRRSVVAGGWATLEQLGRLDELVAAHLSGIDYQLDAALECCAFDDGRALVQGLRAIARLGLDGLLDLMDVFADDATTCHYIVESARWSPHSSALSMADEFRSNDQARVARLATIARRIAVPRQPRALVDPRIETTSEDGFRLAAETGHVAHLPLALRLLGGTSDGLERSATWCAVMLGDRGAGLEAALHLCAAGRLPRHELAAALCAAGLDQAMSAARRVYQHADARRSSVVMAALIGSSQPIPWLVELMADPALARLAGESFSMITGADLAWLDLDRKPPENFASGPNDDPDDPNVDMDEDDGLPWPDPEKVGAWWKANAHRFPAGQRFFMGQPPGMAHCLEVLKTGYQRQRMAAAIWRCILQPGTPLFPTDAPAWRQKRWLAGMSA